MMTQFHANYCRFTAMWARPASFGFRKPLLDPSVSQHLQGSSNVFAAFKVAPRQFLVFLAFPALMLRALIAELQALVLEAAYALATGAPAVRPKIGTTITADPIRITSNALRKLLNILAPVPLRTVDIACTAVKPTAADKVTVIHTMLSFARVDSRCPAGHLPGSLVGNYSHPRKCIPGYDP
jgi:hypothetical protein